MSMHICTYYIQICTYVCVSGHMWALAGWMNAHVAAQRTYWLYCTKIVLAYRARNTSLYAYTVGKIAIK